MRSAQATLAIFGVVIAVSEAIAQGGPCEPSWRTVFPYSELRRSSSFEGVLGLFSGVLNGEPVLAASGQFRTPGALVADNVGLRRNGRWEGLDEGLSGAAFAFAIYDDGTGPALHTAGYFPTAINGASLASVGKWDGVVWRPLGLGLRWDGDAGQGLALCVHDDGSGPALYVAGVFDTAGDVPVTSIARWNGDEWSAVGNPLAPSPFLPELYGLASIDLDGPGPQSSQLIVAGSPFLPGSALSEGVLRWDGAQWHSMDGGLHNGAVLCLATHDDGSGAALYAGGSFNATWWGEPARGVARWTGSAWAPVGDGFVLGAVYGLASMGSGPGATLCATGRFTHLHPNTHARGAALWDGSVWSPMATGVGFGAEEHARLVVTHDEGDGRRFIVGGNFEGAGESIGFGVVEWTGSEWTNLSNQGFDAPVRAIAPASGGSSALIAGGAFSRAGDRIADHVAEWDGVSWRQVGPGLAGGEVYALLEFDDGAGARTFAAGAFNFLQGQPGSRYIAKRDGTTWVGVNAGFNSPAFAMAVFDEDAEGPGAPALFVGGAFSTVTGGTANRVARWDGAQWSGVGTGMNNAVRALAVFDDDGPGPNAPMLYAAGDFTLAGGAPAGRLARWNGVSWSPAPALATGAFSGRVSALLSVDSKGPLGRALYAAGAFATVGGTPMSRIARFDGQEWGGLETGLTGGVMSDAALCVFDDVSGEALYVGGLFDHAGSVAANNLAKWDGSAWSSVQGGTDGAVLALHGAATLGARGELRRSLYVGGAFDSAGGVHSTRFAELVLCEATCPGDANGDRAVNFADLNLVLSNFGAAGAPGSVPGDVTGDGVVNFEDLNVVLSFYGVSC